MGHEVWPVNTVEFSNHTGYGAWRGKALGAELVSELVKGIEDRNALPSCEAVLSGYLGDANIGYAVNDAVKRVKSARSSVLYCCDPVMGDVGRGLYVHPDIPSVFNDVLIPCADIITPNQFELELLTGLDTSNMKNLKDAVKILHEKGPRVILVTSCHEKTAGKSESKTLDMIVSDGNEQWRITTPELSFNFIVSGTGDLCTAIFLSRYIESANIKTALEMTASSIYGVLEATHKAGVRELLLVNAQKELVKPSNSFKSETI
jgi:pyridoxine kinase